MTGLYPVIAKENRKLATACHFFPLICEGKILPAFVLPRTLKPTRYMQKNLKSFFAAQKQGLDEKSVDFLIKALEKSNLPGFDYIEYKQSLASLAEMVELDERTRYKSALASAMAFGLNKDKLLGSADHYKKILTSEREQFNAALQKQIDQRVSAKKQEVEKLRKQIEEYQSKIKELESKIAQTQSTINQQDDLIQAAMAKIESTKDGFESTLSSIMAEIDQDINNIQVYL